MAQIRWREAMVRDAIEAGAKYILFLEEGQPMPETAVRVTLYAGYAPAARCWWLNKGPDTFEIRGLLRAHGGRWRNKRWEFPLDRDVIWTVLESLAVRSIDLDISALKEWQEEELQREAISLALGDKEHHLPAGIRIYGNSHIDPAYEHQRAGAGWLKISRGAMLLDDCGLGKTRQAIDAAESLLEDWAVESRRVVVICPNTLKFNWEREYLKWGWTGLCSVPTGSIVNRKRQIEECLKGPNLHTPVWYVLNYESLRHMPETFLKIVRGSILICDEFHRLKNFRAQVTKIVGQSEPGWIWGLTATPVANRPDDLYALGNLCRPGIFGSSWYGFEKRHVRRNQFGAITGFHNLEILRKKLALFSLGRQKRECVDLPPKVYERRDVELTSVERKAYTRMKKELIAWIEDEMCETGRPTMAMATTFAARFLRLRQLTCGMISEGADGEQAWAKPATKLVETVRVWEDAGKGSAVVWCWFRPTIAKLAEMFEAAGAAVCQIHGDVPAERRLEVIEFWEGTLDSVLICQMQTAHLGINLHHANLEIFVDVPLTPEHRKQAEDRLHRIGQTQTVTVVDIIARDTVDEAILKKLRVKQKDVAMVTAASYGLGMDPEGWKELLG